MTARQAVILDSFSAVARALLPQSQRHKGSCGRVGIVGGSALYCGAPYLAAMAALRVGGDLAYVLCPPEAAPAIKAYSPELIVCPVRPASFSGEDPDPAPQAIPGSATMLPQLSPEEAKAILASCHTVVIGPGLGRSPQSCQLFDFAVATLTQHNTPTVIDADGLYWLIHSKRAHQLPATTILTPNRMELHRLAVAPRPEVGSDPSAPSQVPRARVSAPGSPRPQVTQDHVLAIARKYRAMILSKGHSDIACDGIQCHVVAQPRSPRRCGGQGDVLAGVLGTTLAWWSTHLRQPPDHPGAPGPAGAPGSSPETKPQTPLAVIVAAASIVREAQVRAFSQYRYGMLASHLLDTLAPALEDLLLAPSSIDEAS